jgi:hypothetical protein
MAGWGRSRLIRRLIRVLWGMGERLVDLESRYWLLSELYACRLFGQISVYRVHWLYSKHATTVMCPDQVGSNKGEKVSRGRAGRRGA